MPRPALFLLLITSSLAAQSIDAPPQTPTQVSAARDSPLNPSLPTVFIVGDSTARNPADLGWGDHFAPLFDTGQINIANRARAGRSSRSYFNEGLWDSVLSEIKLGDFVIIQMGHNDGGGNPLNDPKARSTVKGIGEDTVDFPLTKSFTSGPLAGKTTETVHTYGWYLRKFISDTRAKGATPLLFTLTVRNIWKPGPDGKPRIERDMGFRDFEYQIGAVQHVSVIDMATVAADGFESLGPEKTAAYFPIDHTHTSAAGADLNAHSIATALRIAHSPLAAYLKPNNSSK
jgi:rhamnogalacturonan acetylesterase